ncbi:MAG: hypothetical protein R3F59_25805 [Myxococcota bacterium]
MEGAVESVGIRVTATCPGCNRAVYLPGVVQELLCPGCARLLRVGDLWPWVGELCLAAMNRSAGKVRPSQVFGPMTMHLEVVRERPVCAGCGEAAALAGLPAPVACGCGRELAVRELPGALRIPGGRFLVGEGAVGPAGRLDGPPLVQMRCQGCGGELTLDGQTARDLTCGYCGSVNVVSDELWVRLHPELQPRTFWAVCGYDARGWLALKAEWLATEQRPRNRAPLLRDEAAVLASWPAVEGDPLADWLSRAPVERRLWLASWEETPDDLLATLATDRGQVKEALARRPGLPEAVQVLLAGDKSQQVAQALLARGPLPEPVALALADHADPAIRKAVAKRPEVPVAAVVRLAEAGVPNAVRALQSREVEPAVLAASSAPSVRALAAAQEALPDGVLAQLLQDPAAEVRHAAAARPALPGSAVAVALASDDPVVQRSVLRCGDLPAEALSTLVERQPDALEEVLARPDCPEAVLAAAVARSHRDLERAVARHPAVTPALREALARRSAQTGDEPLMKALEEHLPVAGMLAAASGSRLQRRAAG